METPPAAAHWWSCLIGKVRAQTLVLWAINVDWRVDSLAYTRRLRLLLAGSPTVGLTVAKKFRDVNARRPLLDGH